MTRAADVLIYAGGGIVTASCWLMDWRLGLAVMGSLILAAGVLLAIGGTRDARNRTE